MLRHLSLVRGLSGRVLQWGQPALRGLYGPKTKVQGVGEEGGWS